MHNNQREPSAVGRLILDALAHQGLRRPAVAAAIGINNRFMWEIIYDKSPLPLDRVDRLASALQLTEAQHDALIQAYLADRRRRTGRWRRPAALPPSAPLVVPAYPLKRVGRLASLPILNPYPTAA